MKQPIKVAILGGGMGALSAAWELSRQSNAAERFDITVYQRGWRLGGKGAAGSALESEQYRIEEHGIHILMGFYDNTFEVLKDCYDELARDPALWPHGDPIRWEEALTRQNLISVGESRPDGAWEIWDIPLDGLKPLGAGVSVTRAFLVNIYSWIRTFLDAISSEGGGMSAFALTITATEIAALPESTRAQQMRIASALDAIVDGAWRIAEPRVTGSTRMRQLVSGLYLACVGLIGLIKDGVIIPPHDFSGLDVVDFKEWLRYHGGRLPLPKELSWYSPLVRAVYDLVFSMDRTIAAGVTCYHLINILFGWKDEVYYKMNAGMGDIVFAPLYLTLKNRGVKFRFFHRATAIDVDEGDRSIRSITLERQVEVPASYEPIAPHPRFRFPSWPSEPITSSMPEPYREHRNLLDAPPHDFETESESPFSTGTLTLTRGEHFDVVVLGISVGGLKGELGRPLRVNPRFDAMLEKVGTMPTQAAQLWFKPDPEGAGGLGWTVGRSMAGYAEPFSACSDMSQVKDKEDLPSGGAKTLAYLCGAFPDAPLDKGAAAPIIERNLDSWLATHGATLWPGAYAGGRFDRAKLVDPALGVYIRSNSDPSDR